MAETTLRPYPEYQTSGHEWLGRVPAHWPVLPNRALFREVKDQNHPDEPMLSVTISRGVIPQEVLLADSSKKDSSNLDKSKYKLVEPGDIAYNKMRAWQGALGVSEHRGIVSPAYIVVRPRQEVDPRYFHYLLRTPSFVKEAERWSYGITSDMWSLRHEDFKQIYCVLPPLDEQRQMARYLDQQHRGVGRLIRAKQRLIALLNEQKQAIIQRAVTRGLDQDVPLKLSGVDWLGAVPEHWDVVPLKRTIRAGTSISYGIVQPGDHVPGGVPFLQTSNITKPSLDTERLQRTTRRIAAAYPRSRLAQNDVILGIRASIGAAHVVPAEFEGANLSRGIARIVLGDRLLPAYLVNFLRSPAVFMYWDFARQGTTFHEVSIETVKELPVTVPSKTEQREVVAYVLAYTEPLDEAIRTTQFEIDLIREYRTRLIADVVSGKLDVRGVEVPEVEGDGAVADLDVAEDDEILSDDTSLALEDVT